MTTTIQKILEEMDSRGLIAAAQGNCVMISDILQHMLAQQGIASRMVECTLIHTCSEQDGTTSWAFVGYDSAVDSRHIDTHMIVIADVSPPLLLDLSIQHILPPGKRFMAHPVTVHADPTVIAEIDLGPRRYRYQLKATPRFPELHQSRILDRIQQDRQHRRTLRLLMWIVVLLTVVGMINIGLNLKNIWDRQSMAEDIEKIHRKID